jgi:hypothetical protein
VHDNRRVIGSHLMQDNLTRPLRAIGSCLCILVLAVTSNHSAGAANQAVTTVFAVVVKRLDTKSARLDQELTLRTIRDVVLDGVVIIPSGSRVVGHVVEVATKGKGSQQSILAIVIDNAVLETGTEIPLQAIIAAVAAPPEDALSSDPTYGMMHSNEPRMDAKGAASAARTGDLSPSSKADSTATVSTARINGGTDKGLLVKADSQGAIGFSDLSLTWRLTSPPAISVFSSNNKEVKLEVRDSSSTTNGPTSPAT